MANSVVTRAFCLTTPSMRSRLHFFPSAGTAAGHYSVACEISVFGKGIERRSVRLEGGRLNQPDGIRLEDAFPALDHETSGMCGVEVVFECSQSRLNLCNSRLIIEVVSPNCMLSYAAAPFVRRGGDGTDESSAVEESARVGVAIQDSLVVPSLVIVNPNPELLRPEFQHATMHGDAPVQLGTVAPESVVEFSLEESVCKGASIRELLWDSAVIERLWAKSSWAKHGVGCYILYRDPVSKRPISVCAL